MSPDHIYYECPTCKKQYDLYSLAQSLKNCQMTSNKINGDEQVTGKCDCGVEATFVIKSEYSKNIDAAIQTLFDTEELAAIPEPRPNDEFGLPDYGEDLITTNRYVKNNTSGTCSNPYCNTIHSLEKAQEQAQKRGIAFAYCGETVFQVIECSNPKCSGKIVFHCDVGHPALDMRQLILIPIPTDLLNMHEQYWILKNWGGWHDYLKFKYVPAWDESVVSVDEFINSEDREHPSLVTPETLSNVYGAKPQDIPILMTEDDFRTRLAQENICGKIKVRRLVPDTPKFRILLNCLAPDKISEIYSPGITDSDGTGPWDLSNRREVRKINFGPGMKPRVSAHIKKNLR